MGGGKKLLKKEITKSTSPILTINKRNNKTHFPIVGIGASAGGLEATEELFKHLPSDITMAFVLIQHLDPHHKSMLTDILSRKTKMRVQEAENNMLIEPNCVYVIPPNAILTISNKILKVSKKVEKPASFMPIDLFFQSLARDLGSRSIGIILSGNASDGTLGLKAIKTEGGITFGQSEGTAKYSGMPHNAIVSGHVDFILPPREIASKLVQIIDSTDSKDKSFLKKAIPSLNANDQEIFNRIISLLSTKIGTDFTYYKPTTTLRRVMRRVTLLKIDNLKNYHKYLHDYPSEIENLYKDILIKVTSFFREPVMFKALTNKFFLAIMKNKAKGSPIRIWVPGCSTGEEAYSIAINLLEYLGSKANNIQIQIFATDIDKDSIDKARKGIYSKNIKKDISAQRLQRFFTKTQNGDYQINKTIRDLCLFAKHDITKDPPFSKIDIISCRNLLIYFEDVLQKKIIPTFHHALNPHGYLILGPSETISSDVEKFNLVDKKQKIYSKKNGAKLSIISKTTNLDYLPKEIRKPAKDEKGLATIPLKSVGLFDIQKEYERLMLNKYTPATVLINQDMEILHFHGKTNPYLEHSSGKASFQLLRMAKEGLKLDLRTLVQKAMKTNTPVKKEGIYIEQNGKSRGVNIEVNPIKDPVSKENYFLIIFKDVTFHKEEKESIHKVAKSNIGTKKEESRRIAALKNELATTKEYLQSLMEQQETINEELKSTNEEILSSNEELQSTNEELETAKEELESTNEELIILNEELQNRNETLTNLSNDLNNVLSNTDIVIMILGSNLTIRLFTPMAEKVLSLIPGDVGRPITNIKTNLSNLEIKVRGVLDTLKSVEEELQDNTGKWYSLRIKPYRTSDNKIDGVVITLIDIQSRKEAENVIQESLSYSTSILETIRDPFVILNKNLKVVSANHRFYKTFKVEEKETKNKLIYELGDNQWDIPKLKELLEAVLLSKTEFNDYEVEHNFKLIGQKTMLLNARQVFRGNIGEELVLLAIEDITERRRAELINTQNVDLEKSNKELEHFAYVASHDLQEPLRMIASYTQLLSEKYSDKLDDNAKEYIGFAVDGAKRMQELINALLEYSKIGRQEKSFEKISSKEVINTVLESMKLVINETNAKVTFSGLPEVMGNKAQLSQLFQNLIGNAIKYRKKEEAPQINISCKKKDGEYLFDIKDNGIGFEQEFSDRIFVIFQRLHTKTEYSGTGIGLAICKKIVEQHTGKIWADSELGKGSTFHFTLPIEQSVYTGGG